MALAWTNTRSDADPLGRVDYRSPSLTLLVDRLEAPGRNDILDLGPAIETNVRFFSGVPCTLHVEDLGRCLLPRLGEPPPEEEDAAGRAARLERLVAESLWHRDEARFDIILGWDLFNYLDPPTITAVMTRIGRCCHEGTLLFLMVSTLDDLPAAPARVTLSSDRRVIYEPDATATVPCPRYTPLALERMMPRFRLFHSFLLGDGMQDYLFCFE